jgi:hypothetical protein
MLNPKSLKSGFNDPAGPSKGAYCSDFFANVKLMKQGVVSQFERSALNFQRFQTETLPEDRTGWLIC